MVNPSKKPTKKKKRKSPVEKFFKQTSKLLNDAAKTVIKPFEPLLSKKKRKRILQTKAGRSFFLEIISGKFDETQFQGKTIFEVVRELQHKENSKKTSTSADSANPEKDQFSSDFVGEYEIVDENNKVEGVKLIQRFGFEEYLDLAKSDPDKMVLDDWIALVGQTTTRLESQLKFVLGKDIDEQINLLNLLKAAQNEEIFDEEQLSKLHHFRKYYRNKILHGQRRIVDEPYHIIWCADLTLEMGKDEIVTVVETYRA